MFFNVVDLNHFFKSNLAPFQVPFKSIEKMVNSKPKKIRGDITVLKLFEKLKMK